MTPGDLTESAARPARRARSPLARWPSISAHGSRRERRLWLVATVALLADVVTTLAGIQLGLSEGNPLIASTLAVGGVVGFLAVKGSVLAIGVGVRAARPRYRLVIPLGLALPWAVAAVANVLLISGSL